MCRIGKTFDVSLQIIAHFLDSGKDAALSSGGEDLNVPYGSWFELNRISHLCLFGRKMFTLIRTTPQELSCEPYVTLVKQVWHRP